MTDLEFQNGVTRKMTSGVDRSHRRVGVGGQINSVDMMQIRGRGLKESLLSVSWKARHDGQKGGWKR